MLYGVWDIEEGKQYIFTSREKAEKCIEYLSYFDVDDWNNGARITEIDECTVDVVPDITSKKLTAGTTIITPKNECPTIEDALEICIRSAESEKDVGDVYFSADANDDNEYIYYFIEKVYQVKEGESKADFHKRILEDMNKELSLHVSEQFFIKESLT